jgi:hypothetical protein
MSDLDLLKHKMDIAERKMRDDLIMALGSREEQLHRLDRLMDLVSYPTKDSVFVKCWETSKVEDKPDSV